METFDHTKWPLLTTIDLTGSEHACTSVKDIEALRIIGCEAISPKYIHHPSFRHTPTTTKPPHHKIASNINIRGEDEDKMDKYDFPEIVGPEDSEWNVLSITLTVVLPFILTGSTTYILYLKCKTGQIRCGLLNGYATLGRNNADIDLPPELPLNEYDNNDKGNGGSTANGNRQSNEQYYDETPEPQGSGENASQTVADETVIQNNNNKVQPNGATPAPNKTPIYTGSTKGKQGRNTKVKNPGYTPVNPTFDAALADENCASPNLPTRNAEHMNASNISPQIEANLPSRGAAHMNVSDISPIRGENNPCGLPQPQFNSTLINGENNTQESTSSMEDETTLENSGNAEMSGHHSPVSFKATSAKKNEATSAKKKDGGSAKKNVAANVAESAASAKKKEKEKASSTPLLSLNSVKKGRKPNSTNDTQV